METRASSRKSKREKTQPSIRPNEKADAKTRSLVLAPVNQEVGTRSRSKRNEMKSDVVSAFHDKSSRADTTDNRRTATNEVKHNGKRNERRIKISDKGQSPANCKIKKTKGEKLNTNHTKSFGQSRKKQKFSKPDGTSPSINNNEVKREFDLSRNTRNVGGVSSAQNKWDAYRKKIHRSLLALERSEHFASALSAQCNSDKVVLIEELSYYNEQVEKHKKIILDTVKDLESENSAYQRYPELSVGDRNGMVYLEAINCSRCGKRDTEGDDILFCDREGCCRAYHQFCLEPPLAIEEMNFDDPEEPWFCWQCECLDDCFDLINRVCDKSISTSADLFPELNANAANGSIIDELSSESDDDDYDSQCAIESGEDDSECSENESESDIANASISSSISEDEMQGLINDSGINGCIGLSESKMNLRDRGAKAIVHRAYSPSDVTVGQHVARIKKGWATVGQVVSIASTPIGGGRRKKTLPSWVVEFDGEKIDMKWEELLQCIHEYDRHEEYLAKIEKKLVPMAKEECDPANIIRGKRHKNKVDYVMLNEAIFGADDDHIKTLLQDENDDKEYKAPKSSIPTAEGKSVSKQKNKLTPKKKLRQQNKPRSGKGSEKKPSKAKDCSKQNASKTRKRSRGCSSPQDSLQKLA